MKRTIEKLDKINVDTKYGNKEKYLIKFAESPEKLIGCWVGNWNRHWEEGTEIEIEADQMETKEYNDKTYYNLKAPAEARFQGVGRDEFDLLVGRVDELEQFRREMEGIKRNS